MDENAKTASFWFMLVILAIGLVATVTTIYVGHALTDPPGFMAWMTIGFLCFIEFLVTVLGINGLVGKRRRRRPSGAILIVSFGVVGIYAAIGLLSIIVYNVLRDSAGSDDSRFVAVLVAETVIAFIIVTLLYAYDFFIASASQALIDAREHHAAGGRSIRSVLGALKSLQLAEPELLQGCERLTKKLQRLETALAHSHGGGVGSREAGWQHPRDPNTEAMVDNTVGGLNAAGARLTAMGAEGAATAIEEMDRLAAQLESALDSLQLL